MNEELVAKLKNLIGFEPDLKIDTSEKNVVLKFILDLEKLCEIEIEKIHNLSSEGFIIENNEDNLIVYKNY